MDYKKQDKKEQPEIIWQYFRLLSTEHPAIAGYYKLAQTL